MTRLAVIADDLTGALDTVAPFAARGLEAAVAIGPDWIGETLSTNPYIVGVSTDSREVDVDAACESVRRAVHYLSPDVAIIKKVDSRLKGNIEAELDAIPFEKALVIPAIPAFGRRVKDGMLEGFGVDRPISIAERLGRYAARAIIPDTDGQDDIKAALIAYPDALMVGARGLSEAVAARMSRAAGNLTPDVAAQRVIVVVGSRDPITLTQVDYLIAERPDADHIPAPAGYAERSINQARAITVVQAQDAGRTVDPKTVACRLAQTLVQGTLEDALVLITGGATAQIVLERLNIGVLHVLGEALPGMPIAQTKQFKLITKSGGFGAPDALLSIVRKAFRAGE